MQHSPCMQVRTQLHAHIARNSPAAGRIWNIKQRQGSVRRTQEIAAWAEHGSRSNSRALYRATLTGCSTPGLALTAALSMLAAPGAAMADAQQEAQSPPVSLPTPSEVVRSLSDQLIGGPPSLEAPPLTDSPSENTSDPSQDASAQDADKAADDTSKPANGKNGKSNGKTAEQTAEAAMKDAELQEKFEKEVLPKIVEQLKGLDQNEEPNDVTIELKRQLRRAEDDIYRLLKDLKESKSEAARAEATGLQREFEDIREYVKKNGGTLVDE
mmetsp:Transcript_8296/g.24857  ORF Transcript_8296/g.24857 Transcript_8296/m.24857 type:complete len:270 (+) Transcript_8296:262-1071(+)|eukprot:CAMPEP_0206135096 /NCGR_PEP_ID=MMETSP1473-20131121/461_1 /ASSEMBLY_ACC=CAM_ASM_001109 /TAXON_ID=1461547 /ORGANISM="Stichococcus sp, Strain RCC1054" /LENGTH=269 /DNA_ID=CAMNT_0053526829 /DNA_START=225 /DNA_END=1034 /DNA_ORIENTATION=-